MKKKQMAEIKPNNVNENDSFLNNIKFIWEKWKVLIQQTLVCILDCIEKVFLSI